MTTMTTANKTTTTTTNLAGADILAMAVAFPRYERTTEWFKRQQPDLVANEASRSLAKLWQPPPADAPGRIFAEAMAPYLNDPFRGTVARRVLGPGESSVTLGAQAARAALAAAKMTASDVDLALVSALLPTPIGCGDAVYLARELGLRGAAFNLESNCASALLGLQTAAAFVRSGEYRRVLVVVSCTYSRNMDLADTLSWSSGDGAVAFLLGPCEPGQGILGAHSVHTADTIDALYVAIAPEPNDGKPFRLRTNKKGGAALRDTAEPYLRRCTDGALKAAGLTRKEIDFLVVTTPTAWYADFAARVLGFDKSQTIDLHPAYANIGPVLMPANLFHAASAGKIRRGDRVLLYAIGSVSSAGAMVVRWGDVKLGPVPEPGVPEP
ncbi:MAG TPA: 3-oxoacyl-[acyl-carrier-protein] synthase III C-terminal domain-containing protein [Myxococcales bacterium]|jgi:3-oxoacyl-[acyl-carrier-protein] synthase-3